MYHIHKPKNTTPDELNVGDIISTTLNKNNPFFNYYEQSHDWNTIFSDTNKKTKTTVKNLLKALTEEHYKGPIPDLHPNYRSNATLATISLHLIGYYEIYARELLFEHIRVTEFPRLPSRHSCIFLCETKEQLNYWKKHVASNHKYKIFKVDLKTVDNMHFGDNKLIPAGVNNHSVNKEMAKKYWSNTNNQGESIEILFEGKLEVVEVVESV